uniref:Innexin n=1 Tax=Schmidtea mediterranea TaxID=79327 RepID=I1ZIL2_SCHMD|nr:innexin-1 [Schmidtea mediterranea]
MVFKEFLDYLNKFNFIHACGVYDIFDRCVYILTFTLLLVCSATVTIKSYVLEPMTCYAPSTISGSNVLPYINNYCWIVGTIPKAVHEHNSDDEEYWKWLESRKINYYQWVPFVLGLQAALLYIPYVFWECLIYNRLGTNLQFLIDLARKASLDFGESRQRKISQMAGSIFILLTTRKKKSEKAIGLLSKFPIYKMEIVFHYLLLKVISIVMICSQFVIMEKLLNMNGKHKLFGITVLQDLLNGRYWDVTNLFPRMAFCRVPFKMQNTNVVNITTQCSLSINLINEKIFLFLWWWFSLIASLQIISLFIWVARCLSSDRRVRFINHSAQISRSFPSHSEHLIKQFDRNLISIDGIFLIHMTRINCGDLICNELIHKLYEIHATSLANRGDDLSDSISHSSVYKAKDIETTMFI